MRCAGGEKTTVYVLVDDDIIIHRVSKNCANLIFCQNFVKFRLIVEIFGTKIAKKTSFCDVYSFATSPNLCQSTTVLNSDVPNCVT